ncbi:MAG TPA: hypothetical protein VF275_05825 [Gammaproteobacteria bacterium]
MTWIAASLLAVCAVNAGELTGELHLTENGRATGAQEYADAVIFFVPDSATVDSVLTADMKPPPQATLEMRGKKFLPRVLPVVAGTEVAFTNFDPILHNAFSTARQMPFDLGFYSGGENRNMTFETPGLVRVYCNVHHDMVAYVLVLDTPHFTRSDAQGKFRLRDLPEGKGTLYIWHPRARPLRESLTVNASNPPDRIFELALTERRIPRHPDKHGNAYRNRRDRNY